MDGKLAAEIGGGVGGAVLSLVVIIVVVVCIVKYPTSKRGSDSSGTNPSTSGTSKKLSPKLPPVHHKGKLPETDIKPKDLDPLPPISKPEHISMSVGSFDDLKSKYGEIKNDPHGQEMHTPHR